jgi:hypothetical protein
MVKAKFENHKITFDEFCEYRHLTWSRNFNIVIDDFGYGTMIPIADLFNFHPDKINVEWFLNMETKCFNIKAIRDISKGEEIFLNYGCHGNMKYLFYYGFAIPQNSNLLTYDFEYHAEKITLVNPVELLEAVVSFRKSKRTSIVKIKPEIMALDKFGKELVRILKNYPFTINEAKQKLDQAETENNFNLINIFTYLVEELELIYSYVKAINEIKRILQEKDSYIAQQKLKHINVSPKYIQLIEHFLSNQ